MLWLAVQLLHSVGELSLALMHTSTYARVATSRLTNILLLTEVVAMLLVLALLSTDSQPNKHSAALVVCTHSVSTYCVQHIL